MPQEEAAAFIQSYEMFPRRLQEESQITRKQTEI